MSIISNAVKVVDKIGGSLKFKSKVTLKSLKTDAVSAALNAKGDLQYNSVKYLAFVDRKQRLVRTFQGEESMSTSTVIIAKPGVLVKEHDRIVLDDGTDQPVIGSGGYVDGATNRQAFTEAYLG